LDVKDRGDDWTEFEWIDAGGEGALSLRDLLARDVEVFIVEPLEPLSDSTADEFCAVAGSTWIAKCRTGTTRERQRRSVPMVIVAGHITVEPRQQRRPDIAP
jgi:hypothetical protein